MRSVKPGKSNPALAATSLPTALDIAWAAGIFEGEGSGGGGTQVQVGQRKENTWLLQRLRDLFGGSIRFKHAPEWGGEVWAWCVSGGRARWFIAAVLSFLSPFKRWQLTKAGWI